MFFLSCCSLFCCVYFCVFLFILILFLFYFFMWGFVCVSLCWGGGGGALFVFETSIVYIFFFSAKVLCMHELNTLR